MPRSGCRRAGAARGPPGTGRGHLGGAGRDHPPRPGRSRHLLEPGGRADVRLDGGRVLGEPSPVPIVAAAATEPPPPEPPLPEDQQIRRPHRISIDSLTALERISTRRTFHEFIVGLITLLKAQEALSLFTYTASSLVGDDVVTEAYVSTMSDGILLLRYIDPGRRAVTDGAPRRTGQHPQRAAATAGADAVTGSRNVNVVSPDVEATLSRPRIRSASSEAIASPSPEPAAWSAV